MGTMKVFACVLLAVAAHAAPEADPALLYGGYAGYAGVLGYPYAAAAVVPAASVVTGNSVPVAVGGYKAVAGSNGDLAGPVHEVPGLVPALAVQKQESSGDVSLSTGTGAVAVTHAVHAPVVYYGKRSAEPQLVYAGPPAYHHALTYAVPTVAVKPLTLNTEVVATGQSVPVAVGGYKAEAGDNGDLKGAVHEVPGLVPAPALNKQENTNGGALTVGTGAFVKYSLSKRSAEADPAILASTVSYVNPVSTVYHAPTYAYAPYTYAAAHAPLLWG